MEMPQVPTAWTCHAQRAAWYILMWQIQDDLRGCRDQITGDRQPVLEPTGL